MSARRLPLLAFALCKTFAADTATAAPTGCLKDIGIGWDTSPPYQEKVGEAFTGIDLDLLQLILGKMGCRFHFVNEPWKRILADIQKGDLDLTASAMKSPEREAFAYFSDAYIETRNLVLMHKGDPTRYPATTLTAFAKSPGFRLGVCLGYEYGPEFTSASKDPAFAALLETTKSEDQNLKKLLAHRLSGMLVDEFIGLDLARRAKVRADVEFHPLALPPVQSFVIFSKASTSQDFRDAFNNALAEIKKSGDYARIVGKYRD